MAYAAAPELRHRLTRIQKKKKEKKQQQQQNNGRLFVVLIRLHCDDVRHSHSHACTPTLFPPINFKQNNNGKFIYFIVAATAAAGVVFAAVIVYRILTSRTNSFIEISRVRMHWMSTGYQNRP